MFDAAHGRAVMAFRKVNWLPRRFDADRDRRAPRARRAAARSVPRHPSAGRHVEADLSRQVLALIDRGQVVPRLPHLVGRARHADGDRHASASTSRRRAPNVLGMVDSSYFIRGYAIHGYVDVPAFNASHGCLRVPLADARRIFDWLRLGDRVIVYP